MAALMAISLKNLPGAKPCFRAGTNGSDPDYPKGHSGNGEHYECATRIVCEEQQIIQ